MGGSAGLLARTAELLAELRQRYAEPQRHYHTLEHVDELLAQLAALRLHVRSTERVEWAIWFHDAVYDPRRSDNEAVSASLARERLVELGAELEDVEAVAQMVLATAGHRWSDGDPDTALFLDLDLSILAAPPARYDAYVAQVRAEYAFVPEQTFRSKRAELLRSWLTRPQLYFSEAGRDRFEARARENLARELSR